MIRLQKDQMVIAKADYKALKNKADSWDAIQEKKPSKPSTPTAKAKAVSKHAFGGKS